MKEHEVRDKKDAAFYLANNVVNEYHSHRVVHHTDVGSANTVFIEINQTWYKFEVTMVWSPELVAKLEELSS